MRVGDHRQQLGLAAEPLATRRGVHPLGNLQHLDADIPAECVLSGQIDPPHPPTTEPSKHLVARYHRDHLRAGGFAIAHGESSPCKMDSIHCDDDGIGHERLSHSNDLKQFHTS